MLFGKASMNVTLFLVRYYFYILLLSHISHFIHVFLMMKSWTLALAKTRCWPLFGGFIADTSFHSKIKFWLWRPRVFKIILWPFPHLKRQWLFPEGSLWKASVSFEQGLTCLWNPYSENVTLIREVKVYKMYMHFHQPSLSNEIVKATGQVCPNWADQLWGQLFFHTHKLHVGWFFMPDKPTPLWCYS